MKFIISIILLTSFFSSAYGNDIAQLPDIEPNIEDIQRPEEIEAIEKQLLNDFQKNKSWRAEESLDLNNTEVLRQYNHIDPYNQVPQNLLTRALNYFEKNKQAFANRNYITVVDFSARSNYQRFFIINMSSGQVMSVRTAHGSGSDRDNDGFVESVSNINNSHQSSKGFYKVSEIYYGKYGRSIRLDGLSSTNSRVRSRAIVIHGSDYVREANVIPGRSWGCFALAWSVKDDVVSLINGGSLMYADFSR